jgi:hypothetical protein
MDHPQVVSVRRQALYDLRIGMAVVVAAVAALAVTQRNLAIVAVYIAFETIVAAFGAVRAIRNFGELVDDARPLPSEAVEARPEWELAGSHPLRRAFAVAISVVPVGLLVAFPDNEWVVRIFAGLVALYILTDVVVPLVETSLAARSERTMGRLFRPRQADHGDDAVLYVADRPVPGA